MTIAKLAAIAIIVLATPARAQSAEADVLFREGKQLLKAGKLAEACEKLDASDRLESSVGTLLNLADCREKNHQLATAWATFRKAAVAAKTARDGKREAEAKRREKLLAAKLSYLTVVVAHDVDGMTITRNAIGVDRELWGQAVPVDAGEYEFVVAADGHVQWTQRIHVGDGQNAQLDVPALEATPTPKPEPPAVRAPATRDADMQPAAAPSPGHFSVTRDLAIAVAVIGLAGIASGVVLYERGARDERQANATCPTTTCNDAGALQLNADARRDARDANIAYGAGGALVAGAIVMWIVGAPSLEPVVTREQVGLAYGGHF
ncbi:MAG TPA: hypothetical protein VH143_27840 [Kofleriaceae bacterium]|jgi:serine/threonine-protein kinase|nr:hypothetical protein [Kofleriaceae bacterium]